MKRQQVGRSDQRRRSKGRGPAPVDVWRVPGPLPELAPITRPQDSGALIRSLGEPPMNSGPSAAHYLEVVVHRAAAVAQALALSADLLDEPEA